jgi:signal transduction histidine kinase
MITSASSAPPSSGRRWAVDTALAVAVTGLQVAAWLAASTHSGHPRPGIADYLFLAAGGAALLGRRRYPVPVLAVAVAGAAAAAALGGAASSAPVPWLVLAAAFVNAVVYRKRGAAIASLVAGYLIAVWPPWLIGTHGNTSAASALGLLAGLIALLSAAELIRGRNQRIVAIRNRQAEEARRRASDERLAIARDLHDVVAHNISVINVQANTALHLMDRQPERAREALTAIHEVSRQALGELRSVLGVLRDDGAEAPLVPSPGLDRLSELAAHTRTAGIAVRVVEEGEPRPVPAGVDAAAFRIVQEALTNTVRHSGGHVAQVRLRYDPDALTIEVDDDGRAAHPPRPGNGVAGMTERARALGGTLDAGPRPGGGFRVLARLPT